MSRCIASYTLWEASLLGRRAGFTGTGSVLPPSGLAGNRFDGSPDIPGTHPPETSALPRPLRFLPASHDHGPFPSLDSGNMSENKAQQNDDDLTFVVTTNPYERKSAAAKKRVRSVAALKSWPERRKKTFERHGQSNPNIGGFVLDKPDTAAGPSRPTTKRRSPRSATTADEEDLFEKCTRSTDHACNCVHCRTERRYRFGPSQGQVIRHDAFPQAATSRGSKRTADGNVKARSFDMAMITPPSSPHSPSPLAMVNNSGKAEPFNCYPVEYLPWFDRILHHMLTVFAPRGWPALKISNQEGMHWEWFMTQHAISEPSLFYVRLLFASGDLIRLKTLHPDVSIWLQAQAIKAINEALSDPQRATSDALILAVGRIAMHEAFYGDKQSANSYHRPAQRRMVQMRGGMKALPFPELVKRLMRWADKVMAMQSGTERMLEDDETNENFTLQQHVDVLEKWVPKEGQDLKKKIKISDLLSPEPS